MQQYCAMSLAKPAPPKMRGQPLRTLNEGTVGATCDFAAIAVVKSEQQRVALPTRPMIRARCNRFHVRARKPFGSLASDFKGLLDHQHPSIDRTVYGTVR
jgi:hypothetical protein